MNYVLPCIYFSSEVISKFDDAIRFEWILTNGLGGYSSSTIIGVNTRKFHGLLFIPLNPPTNRHLLLSKIDEEILIGGDAYPLGSNQFRDAIYPKGYRNLKGFAMNPFPSFYYQVHEVYLKKEIFMPRHENAVILRYDILNCLDEDVTLQLYPLLDMRHFYETTRKGDFHVSIEAISNGVIMEFSPKRAFLALSITNGVYLSGEDVWIERIYFKNDDMRGESCLNDCLQKGMFRVNLQPKSRALIYLLGAGGIKREEVISFLSRFGEWNQLEASYSKERSRREDLLADFYSKTGAKHYDWLSWLILSADSFIVLRRKLERKSIIAGYHWFEDWGRDTFISLPGLTLATRRFSDAEEILLTFAEYSDNGLLPSRFPDKAGESPEYYSVDTSLWFFNAILQYIKYTGNYRFVYRHLWDLMQDVIERYIEGRTPLNIKMDSDGLIFHGPRLTWMDAAVNSFPVTPREGKAVEVQALWYNSLKLMEVLSYKFGSHSQSEDYRVLALRAKRSFNEKFWYRDGGYLYDVVCEGMSDTSLRPNQIIAVYLDFPIVEDRSRSRSVVETVWKRLLTPYGLRSLSPDDPRYMGVYSGGFSSRDRAYHNGTAWAWLLGPFITAFLKVNGHEAYWRRFAFERFLKPLFQVEIFRAGLGTLSEIFNGDPPHHPRGCVSQAWSVAEPLRAYIEDILLIRPPHDMEFYNMGLRRDKLV